ncbi:unnamed protein product [Didymodactylos carnosus]|uniref:Serpin domain-containing protein n=1 Tax=Didymodactylos carnosus TaxID=1234261 RepID=A0A813T7U0_9BILA|nr:unnamed protein product [Didymodactylos carnosus]CAF0970410.1 unnamed protein product [Didymodactylos carnosus]CAF3593536.1 unnamed protein product [Didymodactylos carnosus]CAF3741834.1 unnamed protein product [Didymodactylos carnosus]
MLIISCIFIICLYFIPCTETNETLAQPLLHFTAKFARHHSSTDVVGRRNLIWSPLSLYLAMLMAGEGSEGKTFSEFEHITGMKTKDDYHQWINKFFQSLNKHQQHRKTSRASNQTTTFTVANRLYADKTFELNDKYNNILKEHYQSELQLVDFSQQEEAAEIINNWIANKTNDKIKKLLSKKDIHSLTRLILVNALYFKGSWVKSFDDTQTEEGQFYLSTKKIIKQQMMNIVNQYRYYNDPKHNCQWVNIPYQNNEYVLTLALPNKNIPLLNLEKKLRELDGVFDTLNKMSSTKKIQLKLPKFKIESSLDFVKYFKQFYNVHQAFDQQKADFSYMNKNGKPELFISKIKHKAIIEIDEYGTEASAATVITMLSRSGMGLFETPITLTFDKPFLFYLRNIHNNIPLFVGRYTGIS